jgi:hypothetical protein
VRTDEAELADRRGSASGPQASGSRGQPGAPAADVHRPEDSPAPRFEARSADTDPAAEAVQIDLLRRAGVERRAQMALDLSAQVIRLARRAIRRSSPGASEAEVGLRFVELHYGAELAAGVRRRLAGGGW